MYKKLKDQLTNCLAYRLAFAPSAVVIALSAMILYPSGAFALPMTYPSWEVASEFNDSCNIDAANPSGPWSYGEKPTTFGAFTLLTLSATTFAYTGGVDPDACGWTNASGYPVVSHNTHAITLVGAGALATLPPHCLLLHPGPLGENGVVRFTAPSKGTYKVSGQFYAMDRSGTGTITDVYIVKNNTSPAVYSGTVNYYANQKFATFTSIPVTLNIGEYIDFQVGYGTDLTYSYDTTGLNAVIEKIR